MTDDTLTVDEWINTRLEAASQRPQLKEHSGAEPSPYVNLDKKEMTFPFLCSCGVTHQFCYTETPEGGRLEIILS